MSLFANGKSNVLQKGRAAINIGLLEMFLNSSYLLHVSRVLREKLTGPQPVK